MSEVLLKQFEAPDEVRRFELGRNEDGRIVELRPGMLFHIPADPHDSWVVGSEPYVSLHFLGADHYAAR